ncbi:MAG: transglutaminase domain-containing protein [Planctomycetota bacterium]
MTRRRISAADAALLLAVGSALVTLPPALVPWPWVAGYALPAVILLLLQRMLPQRAAVGVVVAMLSLLGAGAVLRAVAPTSPAAPVACILVAPLAYFSLRRQPGDDRYALFLALCVLVVGSVLDLERARLLALPFGLCSTSTLLLAGRAAARRHGLGPRGGVARAWTRCRHGIAVVASVLVAALSMFQLLTVAPVPRRGFDRTPDDAARLSGNSRVGLSESFDLGHADGWLDLQRDLRSLRLAAVKREGGDTPGNLYLRFVHFDLAGANHWTTAKHLIRPQLEPGGWTLYDPAPGWRTVAYSVEREPMSNGNLLLPECSFRVEGIDDLAGHEELGLLREVRPSDSTIAYRVLTLAPTPRMPALRVDPHWRELLSLPEALIGGDIADLAARYGEGIDDDILRAQAIARHLRRDYRYTRREPTGRFPDVLHNFLFDARAGYCMHFASALAVMLRLQHVPCRIGAGLYGGSEDSSRAGWRVYGENDAHAWVEVPCEGAGWVVFDATPSEGRGTENRAITDVPAADDAGLVPEPTDDSAGIAPWRWPAAALFLLGLVLIPSLRRARPLATAQAKEASTVAHPARHLLAATLARLARLGLARRRQETLRQLAARAGALLEVDVEALLAGFSAYEEVRFGRVAWTPAHAERMRAAAGAAGVAKPRVETLG